MKRIMAASHPRRVTANDSTSLASAIYSLELKRKSLRKRHEILQQTLASVERELVQIETQLNALQERQHAQLRHTSLRPPVDDSDEGETFTISY